MDAKHIDEEADQFVGLGGKGFRLGGHFRFSLEEVGIMGREHAAARAAGGDDIVAVGKSLDRLCGDRLGRLPVAGIVGRLATAGLARNDDLAACVFQQFDRGEANGWADDVDQAGNK